MIRNTFTFLECNDCDGIGCHINLLLVYIYIYIKKLHKPSTFKKPCFCTFLSCSIWCFSTSFSPCNSRVFFSRVSNRSNIWIIVSGLISALAGEIKIVKTNDAGKTWRITDLELPSEFCTRLISKVKDSLLLSCNGTSSDFYESSDFGKSWQHVREHESF